MTLVFRLGLLLGGVGWAQGAVHCPGSPSIIHASAQLVATFPGDTCATVLAEVKARLRGANGWTDPHNGGTYTLVEDGGAVLQTSRLTGDGKYTDKHTLTFVDKKKAGGCVLEACSVSQVFSVVDFSTNYCNLHDLYCGSRDGCPVARADFTDYTEQVTLSMGASSDKAACVGPKKAAPLN